VVLILNYVSVSRNIRAEVNDQITVTRELEQEVIEDYFTSYLNELEYFSQGYVHIQNVDSMVNTFHAVEWPDLTDEQTDRLRSYYDSVGTAVNATGLVQVNYEDWFPLEKAARALQYKYMVDPFSYNFPSFERIYDRIHTGVGIILQKFDSAISCSLTTRRAM
jgi:hypothetical protein